MVRPRAAAAAAAAVVTLSLAAAAQAAEPYTCRNGLFPRAVTDPGLARVIPRRLTLRGDDPGCPVGGDACLSRAYVVKGDLVLTGQSDGGDYICVFYPNKVGGSAGWVRRDELVPVAINRDPSPKAWAGRWKNGDDEIVLTAAGGRLTARGHAYWPSANPPLSERPGGPNLGSFRGAARPSGNGVSFAGKDGDDCRVDLRLAGPWLVARDNNACGGMNVSFSGVYRRGR